MKTRKREPWENVYNCPGCGYVLKIPTATPVQIEMFPITCPICGTQMREKR